MKNVKIFGIIAVVAIIGLSMAACDLEEEDLWDSLDEFPAGTRGTWSSILGETYTITAKAVKWEDTGRAWTSDLSSLRKVKGTRSFEIKVKLTEVTKVSNFPELYPDDEVQLSFGFAEDYSSFTRGGTSFVKK